MAWIWRPGRPWQQRNITQTGFTKLAKPTQNALVSRCSFSVFASECTLNARNRRTPRIFQHTKTLLLHCRLLEQGLPSSEPRGGLLNLGSVCILSCIALLRWSYTSQHTVF
ncbi:hypothetical protein AVEN_123384-1 [Araneus ventricosus]|uniref:Uncharacterized protein n=1 Tax=Araneus ventricosus TaxID=182803 RepID=A0A4Y2RLM9_ARAVE|nr:hypothetical protein AVEN_123384-1 [Araneus ventricosus]